MWLGGAVLRVALLAVAVVVGVSLLPVKSNQPSSFADPAFERLYQRTPPTARALLWGGPPVGSLIESYSGAPGNRRLVQYFDRGRMELTGGPSGQRVTQGLLVREMTTGAVQLGDDAFAQRPPAQIPILSTSATEGTRAGPSYADFSAVVGEQAPDRTTETGPATVFDSWMEAGGNVVEQTPPLEVRAAAYVQQTGHNLPDVFAAWFQQQPFGTLDWQTTLGYPISEPFWIRADRNPSRSGGDILVQLFERRVLMYTPGLPGGEQFTLGAVGRHYYAWRYSASPTPKAGPQISQTLPLLTNESALTLPEGFRATILTADAADVVSIAVTADNRVALARRDGTVTVLDPSQPDAEPSEPAIVGLSQPRALTAIGPDLFVADDSGVHRYRDQDGDGRFDLIESLAVILPRIGAELTPGADGTLYATGLLDSGSSFDTSVGLARMSLDDLDQLQLELLDIATVGPFVVDVSGMVWSIDSDGRLVRTHPQADSAGRVLESVSPTPGIAPTPLISPYRELLLYRPDGTNGEPARDLLALITDDGGGRIVRVEVAAGDTPAPSATVDFATGFDDPVSMAAGLDGTLYVVDVGAGRVYAIQPFG